MESSVTNRGRREVRQLTREERLEENPLLRGNGNNAGDCYGNDSGDRVGTLSSASVFLDVNFAVVPSFLEVKTEESHVAVW